MGNTGSDVNHRELQVTMVTHDFVVLPDGMNDLQVKHATTFNFVTEVGLENSVTETRFDTGDTSG